MTDVVISKIETRRDLKDFIDLPWSIYKGDSNWVPPLKRQTRAYFIKGRHPSHEYLTLQGFLARRDGKTVGRIAAIENEAHLQKYGDGVGFFGFFESVDDEKASQALLSAAAGWLKERGLQNLRGPVNPSMNDVCGLLVEGENGTPFFMMPHNPPYYARHLEDFGLRKIKDLHAVYSNNVVIPERIQRSANLLADRAGIRVRDVDMAHFGRELERVIELVNECWKDNWGFIPLTRKEVAQLAKELKPIVDPKLLIFLERMEDAKAVGFALALPDLNLPLKKANGRLFPSGIFHILRAKGKIKRFRLLLLGVAPEIRKRGADSLLHLQIYKNGLERGYVEAEFSWILEDNFSQINPLIKMGGRIYRTYRIYQKDIAS